MEKTGVYEIVLMTLKQISPKRQPQNRGLSSFTNKI